MVVVSIFTIELPTTDRFRGMPVFKGMFTQHISSTPPSPSLQELTANIRQRCESHRAQLRKHGPRFEGESEAEYRRRLLELPIERCELWDVVEYDS
jgi:hypothetical protein